jgi:hypothetical protein
MSPRNPTCLQGAPAVARRHLDIVMLSPPLAFLAVPKADHELGLSPHPSSDKSFAKVRVSKPRQKRQARRDGVVELREKDGADADGRVEIADYGA